MNSRKFVLVFFCMIFTILAKAENHQHSKKHYNYETAKIFHGKHLEDCKTTRKDFCECFKRESIIGCRHHARILSPIFCHMSSIISLVRMRGGGKLEHGVIKSCAHQFHSRKGYAGCVKNFNYYLRECRHHKHHQRKHHQKAKADVQYY